MSKQDFDPIQFKAQQRKSWNGVAAGWNKWWEILEKGAQPVSDRLIDLAKIKAGHQVLDIATGIGEPALTAARRVGDSGSVLATDQAPQMLALARERANTLGLRNLNFKEIDCENIDLPENSFDAVICRWGLMFLPNLKSALTGIHRVLTPGGYFATSVWDTPPKVPMISLSMSVVQEALQLPPPLPGTPNPFSLADIEALKQSFIDTGFTNVHFERLTVTFNLPSAKSYTSFTRDVAAPIVAMLENHPPEKQAEVWDAITNKAQAYAGEDNSINIHNETICVAGQKSM